MQKFIIFVVAVFAITLTTANPTWNQQSSVLDEDNSNNGQRSRQNQRQQTSPYSFSSANNWDDDDNQQSQHQSSPHFKDNSFPNDNDNDNQQQQQRQQQQERQQHQHQQNQRNQNNQWRNQNQSNEDDDDDNSNENSVSSNWIAVQPFHTKINRRLEESSQLADQPQIKQKILRLVDAKMDLCRDQVGGNHGKVDRHCVGYTTGQIMQLIAAVEKGGRDLPVTYEF